MIDFNQIVVFVTVVESGSFTQAAHALQMPKSTVSRKISELETRLGVTLLRRTTRKLALTDVGSAYYESCRHAVSEARLAEQAVHDAEEIPRGTLRVTAPPGMSFIADIVARFMCRYPEVRAELDFSPRRVDVIGDGYDVALRPGPLTDQASLKVRRLGTASAVLVAAPSYLARRGNPQSIDDLAQHECIRFMTSQGVLHWNFETESGPVRFEPQGRFSTNDFRATRVAVFAGLGISMIPGPNIADALEKGELTQVLPDVKSPELPFNALFPAARYLAPRIRAFVDFLTQEFAQDGAWLRRQVAADGLA